MRKLFIFSIVIVFAGITIPFSLNAQEGLGMGNTVAPMNFDSQVNLSNFGKKMTRETFQIQNNLISSDIALPNGLTEEKQKEIDTLWQKLREACPDCSTGGTIRGVVIGGGNISTSISKPLFPIDTSNDEEITITKKEYENLVEMAEKCMPKPKGEI